MKPTHYFVILLFTILTQSPVFAQNQTTLGVSGGMNISSIDFETNADPGDLDTYIGYYGGLRAQFPVKGKFSFATEWLYAVKGWQFDSFIPGQPNDVESGTMHLHYMDVQLVGQYAVTKSMSVAAGVELGTLLKTRRDPHLDIFDNVYQKNEFSLLVGASYKIWKSTRINVKYLHALSHLINASLTDINGNVIDEVKEGSFRILQLGISTDIIKFKSAEQ